MALYDSLGTTYSTSRRTDPRIAARIEAALSGLASVANVGAGTGAYEPSSTVVAVEPSAAMIAQRYSGADKVVQASAEARPLSTSSVDAADGLWAARHADLLELDELDLGYRLLVTDL